MPPLPPRRRWSAASAPAVLAALAVAAGIAVLAALGFPVGALADRGSGHIYAIAHSRELEGRVLIEHECPAGEACRWFGEATAYAPEEECPQEVEAPLLWRGPPEQGAGSSAGRFAFEPEQAGAATVCLYLAVPAEGEIET